MNPLDRLANCRLLVVEDEFFLADELARSLTRNGADVIGPVSNVDDALDLVDETAHLDGAVLDLNLHGIMAYPIADALRERAVPFVFATGYDALAIPPDYGDVPRFEKPVDAAKIVRALFG